MALSEVVAGLTAIPGVRTAAQLNTPNPDIPTTAGDTLPIASALAGLLPAGGLRRGSTVSVTGSAALALALLADATQAGSWAAITGMPDLGLATAAELGVDLDRIALVPDPGAELVAVLSALIDGFDLVVLGPVLPRGIQPQLARRLAGRVRSRDAVLLTTTPWPGADLELSVSGRRWHGITADGFGYLQSRTLVVTSRGRGTAVRPRLVALQLPGPGGAVASAELPATRRRAEVAG